MPDFDVLIIGGGPTGLSAGITTAKKGLSTLLVEQSEEIGKSVACGEIISADKLVTLDNMPNPNVQLDDHSLLLQRNETFIEREMQSQRFFFGSNGVASAYLHTLTINRPLFDKLMAKNAKNNGVEFLLGTQVLKIESSGKKLQITTAKENFRVNVVIVCDGASSQIVKMMNLQPPTNYVQGVEYKIKGVHTDALEFYFDFDNIPHMHCGWVFPKKNETNVGIVTNIASKPMQVLDKFVSSLKNKNIREGEIVQKITSFIPDSGPIPKTFAKNILVSGEAAGMTNTIFYHGITIGIHSGMLAAETALEAHRNKRFNEQQMSKYEEKWRNMPYSDPIIQKAHNVLYSELTGKELNNIGDWIDGWDITTLSLFQKLRLIVKVFRNLDMLKKFNSRKILANGFIKIKEWGF